MTTSTVHTKIYFNANGKSEIRRTSIPMAYTWQQALGLICDLFPGHSFKIHYQDEEGDKVVLENDEEWKECIDWTLRSKAVPLRLYISEGDRPGPVSYYGDTDRNPAELNVLSNTLRKYLPESFFQFPTMATIPELFRKAVRRFDRDDVDFHMHTFADSLEELGRRNMADNKYAEAVEAFLDSNNMLPAARKLFQAANAYERMGVSEKAMECLRATMLKVQTGDTVGLDIHAVSCLFEQVGSSLLNQHRYLDGVEAYLASNKLMPCSRKLYNAACGYALHGQPDKAMEYLLTAVQFGYNNANQFEIDRDLDSLRHRSDFQHLQNQLNGVTAEASKPLQEEEQDIMVESVGTPLVVALEEGFKTSPSTLSSASTEATTIVPDAESPRSVGTQPHSLDDDVEMEEVIEAEEQHTPEPQVQLTDKERQLVNMGFADLENNRILLEELGGDLDLVVDRLLNYQ